MKMRIAVAAWTVVAGLTAAGESSAAPLSGKFVLGGKTLPLKEVAAFRMRDQRSPRSFETYLMVTTKPVDRAAITAAIDPYVVAINDPAVRDTDYLGFSISANGEVGLNAHVGGTQYLDTTGTIMGQKGSLVATCTENSATRVACTVKTAKPVKSMDGPTWSMDLTFSADVASRTPGKPIGKDGEAPGKALLALRKAIAGNDLAKVLALLAPEQAQSYQEDWRSPEENLDAAKDILGAVVPKNPKITGGEWSGADGAVLEVEGEPYEGMRMLYLVEMQKLGGNWVYVSSGSVGMLP